MSAKLSCLLAGKELPSAARWDGEADVPGVFSVALQSVDRFGDNVDTSDEKGIGRVRGILDGVTPRQKQPATGTGGVLSAIDREHTFGLLQTPATVTIGPQSSLLVVEDPL